MRCKDFEEFDLKGINGFYFEIYPDTIVTICPKSLSGHVLLIASSSAKRAGNCILRRIY